MLNSDTKDIAYQNRSPGHIWMRMRMEPPDQRMQSSSTAMNAQISGVFFVARNVTNISAKQQRAVTLMYRKGMLLTGAASLPRRRCPPAGAAGRTHPACPD